HDAARPGARRQGGGECLRSRLGENGSRRFESTGSPERVGRRRARDRDDAVLGDRQVLERRKGNPLVMYDALLILHFFGLALGVGAGLAAFTLGLATKDMEAPERGKFMLRASAIRKNGSFGLLLLIASGLGL